MSDLTERIAKLKEAKAKPAPAKEDPAERGERDQLVVLASRILAEAEAIHGERQRGAAALREQAERWEQSLKTQSKLTLQILRSDLRSAQSEHQQALQQWAARFEEMGAINRMLAKGLLFLVAVFLTLLAWELLR